MSMERKRLQLPPFLPPSRAILGRIIGNIAALACDDPVETPDAALPDPDESPPESLKVSSRKGKGATDAPDEAAEAAAEAATVARKVLLRLSHLHLRGCLV